MKKLTLAIALSTALGLGAGPTLAATIEEKIDILQQELETLKAELVKLKGQQQTPASAQSAEAQGPSQGSGISFAGAEGSAAARNAIPGSSTLGGYGEMIYNNYRDGDVKDQLDFRRFVLFFGHKFSDRLRFFSELEVEHALVEGGEGAVEVEQAYLDYRINDAFIVKGGAFLIPMGILNETHEPPTFFGVERNEVERRIIPSTWRENGIGVHGEIAQGLHYDVGVVSSLDAGKFGGPDVGIREMRTELREAPAHDFAFYGALNYRGIPGLSVGGSLFTGNTGQNGVTDSALKGVNARLTLWDVHGQYRLGGLDLQALYARGKLGDADQVTAAAIARSGNASEIAPSAFWGYYVQAGYHIPVGAEMEVAPFVRYDRYNTQASVPSGLSANPKNNERVVTVGVNFKLHPQVVLKADYQNYKEDNSKDRFNLGLGYMF